MITSFSNKQIKNLMHLQNKVKARNDQGEFVVEGIKMFEEALEHTVKKVYFSESFFLEYESLNQEKLEQVDYEILADPIFKEVSDTMTPQGVLAIVKKPEYQLSEILKAANGRFMLLEDLRDPGNLGTIIRTAEGSGMSAVILSKNSVDLFNPKTVRSTMGSIFRVPYIYADHLEEVMKEIQHKNIRIYAAHLDGAADYDQVDYRRGCGFLIGNEANGLSESIVRQSDGRIKIPMEGSVESLNAAVAASILMYESYRQNRGRVE